MSYDLARRRIGVAEYLPRQVERRLDAVHHQALEVAARVNAAAYVTHVGLTYAGALSAEEGRLIQQAPLGEGRYKAIVDHFAGAVCAEIAGMTY